MRVKDRRRERHEVRIEEINIGEVFEYGNDVYLVTDANAGKKVAVVSIFDGHASDFWLDLPVIPVDAEVVLK